MIIILYIVYSITALGSLFYSIVNTVSESSHCILLEFQLFFLHQSCILFGLSILDSHWDSHLQTIQSESLDKTREGFIGLPAEYY